MASSSSSAAAPSIKSSVNKGGSSLILSQPSGYSAEILDYGGQVISWKNGCGQELLFVSTTEANDIKPPNPIHGGIRVCFPKFFNNENMEQRKLWVLDFESRRNPAIPTPPTDHVYVDLIPQKIIIDKTNWPNRFEIRLRVILSPTGVLTMISRIKNINIDERPFTFPFSYQTYFSVFDFSHIQIEGLRRMEYLDHMQNNERCTQEADAFTFDSAVDRLYMNTPNRITITDNTLRRTLTISKSDSLPDIVVWKRWDADRLVSFGDMVDRGMVCVEAAAVENEIKLNPGEEWTASQSLSVVESNCPMQIS